MVRILVASRRPCDSEAFATSSYGTNFAHPLSAATFVSAAVRVVLPWSMWPIVPTLTCGLDRSNFSFAIALSVYFAGSASRNPAYCGAGLDGPPIRGPQRVRAAHTPIWCPVSGLQPLH